MQIPYKAFTSSPKAAEAVSDLSSGLYLGNCPSHITEWKTKEVKWVSLPTLLRQLVPEGNPCLLRAGESCVFSKRTGDISPKVTSICFQKKYFPSSNCNSETNKTKHFFNGISSFAACILFCFFVLFCSVKED